MNNIKIKYTAGYTAATMPEDLKDAVLGLCIARYLELKGAINAVEGGEERAARLKEKAEGVFDKYRKVR